MRRSARVSGVISMTSTSSPGLIIEFAVGRASRVRKAGRLSITSVYNICYAGIVIDDAPACASKKSLLSFHGPCHGPLAPKSSRVQEVEERRPSQFVIEELWASSGDPAAMDQNPSAS